jgi:hypothetical protein
MNFVKPHKPPSSYTIHGRRKSLSSFYDINGPQLYSSTVTPTFTPSYSFTSEDGKLNSRPWMISPVSTSISTNTNLGFSPSSSWSFWFYSLILLLGASLLLIFPPGVILFLILLWARRKLDENFFYRNEEDVLLSAASNNK